MNEEITIEEIRKKYAEWCLLFDKSDRVSMDDELSKIFLSMCMAEMEKMDISKILESVQTTFLYQVFTQRAEFINLKMTEYVKIFLSSLIKSPGESTMYLYYLKAKYPNELISFTEITNLFPIGFPTEKALSDLWDAQKIGSDNMLDKISISK